MEFIIFLILAITTGYYLWIAGKGAKIRLRMLPQIEAISDGVDKAVEEGKPVICTPGDKAALSGMYAPMTIAGMNIYRYVTTLCVQKGARIIGIVPRTPEILPLMDGIFREVTVAEGKPEAYRREDVRFIGKGELVYTVGVMGAIGTEGCSCFIAIGANSSGTSTPSGFARLYGALTITGTARWGMNGTFAMFSDYFLPMEDIYTAGALCSDDVEAQASIYGGDITKLIVVAIMVLGSILSKMGLPILNWMGI